MLPDTITISSRIDTKTFRDFAVFDTLIRQKRLRSPAIFSGIFLFFSLICFIMREKADQADLLGWVLLSIAILVPTSYIFMFLYSISQKAQELKLNKPHLTYTVNLTDAPDGITVSTATGQGGTLRVRWDQVYHAYRAKSCIYFFVSPRQAFLLPDHQSNVSPDQLWEFLNKKLPAEKLTNRRK